MDLFEAVLSADIDALTETLKVEKNLEIRNTEGWTPLMVAVKSDAATVAMVQSLLDHGANPNALTIEPDPFNFDAQTLAALVETGIDLPPRQTALPPKSVLSIAAQDSSYEKIETLIATGADVRFVDANGYSILLLACYGAFNRNDDETENIFRSLIQSGASFPEATQYGETVVSVLSNHGHFELLEAALELGADPDQLGWTPLFHAIAFQGKPDVEKLLRMGAELEFRDRWQRTPFLVAIIAGKLDVAQLLAIGLSTNRLPFGDLPEPSDRDHRLIGLFGGSTNWPDACFRVELSRLVHPGNENRRTFSRVDRASHRHVGQ